MGQCAAGRDRRRGPDRRWPVIGSRQVPSGDLQTGRSRGNLAASTSITNVPPA